MLSIYPKRLKHLKVINKGFTIVELLVVIVIIGILAAITIVSYRGVSQRAKISSMQFDLSNASRQLKLFQVASPTNDYPTANNCSAPIATEICLKSSRGNTYTYTPNNASNPKTFTLTATNGTTVYSVTDVTSPTAVVSLAISDPANWLQVGTQVWAKYNLNVGTMVIGVTDQTNNSVIEKYCYDDTESNCTTYGAIYQWSEAMQYATTAGAQGICPVGSHIPTDAEWKTLEMQLGMTQVQADATDFRGTNQAYQLIPGGSSGLNIPLAGVRNYYDGSFGGDLLVDVYLWSSSGSGSNAWGRGFSDISGLVDRIWTDKAYGFSVRCVGN
jgi:uncharacterized protein (TIGR02145 family)/prepilin-type N-terminal cleavage/methylation domain-containing protein